MTTMAPGIYTMPAEEYHADPSAPSLSASIAHLLVNTTPAHARAAHPVLNPGMVREEKRQFDIGSTAHSLILEGDADGIEVVEADDWRKKDAQNARDAAREQGKVPLLRKDWLQILEQATAIRRCLDGRDDDPPLFSDGKPEQTLVWEERGITCRARLDWLRDDHLTIDDLKTTARSANPLQWSRNTLWSIGADIQVAFYLRGLKRLTGVDAQFRYVLAETTPPYAVAVVALASSALELGQAKVERAIDRWRECTKTGVWPGYPASVYYAETPAYEELRWLEQDAEVMTA